MNAERFRQVRVLFEAALNQVTARRLEFVREQCGDDQELLQAVLKMLAADAAATDGFIEIPSDLLRAAPALEAAPVDAEIGKRYGTWVIREAIGQGGMGQVYLAERADGAYEQRAALKLMRAGWDPKELLSRFRQERQILAALNHPNIARLLDGGADAEGHPYLVLEYVDGQPIGAYCDQHRLDLRSRLAVFQAVCGAVSYAHQRLVVHRDLKPSNILVTAEGQVKLLDFGIAKLLATDSLVTAPQDRLFTVGYAAPEQVRGELPSVSVDVYALGLLLYELLTGQRAYGRTATTPAAYEREILTAEPELPSRAAISQAETERISANAASRRLDPLTLSAQLEGDLDAIVMRALRKEPDARYASVQAFSEDIQAFLDRRPVQARRGNVRYRIGRFVVRHRLAVGLSTMAVLALCLGLGLALWQAEIARQQRDLAAQEASKAQAVADFMIDVFESADPAAVDGADLRPKDLLIQGARRLHEDLTLDAGTRSALLYAMGSAQLGVSDYQAGLQQMQSAVRAADASGDLETQARAQMGLGVAYNKLSRSQEALQAYLKARALLSQLPNPPAELDEDLDYYTGVEYGQQDQKERAIGVLKSAYTRRLQRLGLAHPKSLNIATTMAFYLNGVGQTDEALQITQPSYQAALANKTLPLHSLKDIVSAHAYTLLRKRDPGAEALFREAMQIDQRIYGEGHPGTAVSLNNLAFVINELGNPGKAAEIIDQVIAIRRGMKIENHQELAFSLVSAAIMRQKAGQAHKAIEHAREGIAIYEARQNGFHRQAQKGRWALTQALEDVGQYQQALQENALMLPYTDGRSAEFDGADANLIWLMQARLLSRLGRAEQGCMSAETVLGHTEFKPAQQLEARILLLDCLKLQRLDAARQARLATEIAAQGALLPDIATYSRERWQHWQAASE